jgi:lactate dehydrogenase-like 2-hydroxyacid dehydrogenase
MKEVVLVTKPEFSKAEDAFRGEDRHRLQTAPPDEASLARRVIEERSRAVIVGVDTYRGPLYEALDAAGGGRGALIARFGVGHDGIDKRLARRHRIVVTNTPGVLDKSVAEHAMWLIGTLARNITVCHQAVASGRFEPLPGLQLHGRTLAILGFGSIGRRVAKAAHFGFGMRVIGADQIAAEVIARREHCPIEEVRRRYGLQCYTNDVDMAFRQADALTIHLPAIESTRHFVNADRLALMKPGALLVNTARGSVLDEDALHDALAAGRLGGAALDVFESEPYQPQSPGRDLRGLSNVVMTPHISSNTLDANWAMAGAALENVHHFLSGDREKLTPVEVGSAAG